MNKLTITIVNYNAGQYLQNCLKSLVSAKDEVDFEVYVIDNDSRDGSIEEAQKIFPQFNYILNKENLGFGKAHNLGLKKTKTPYVLSLNPDVKVLPGVLSFIYEYMEKNPDVGVATPKVEKEDGSLDIASHRGFPTPKASFMYFFLKNDRLYHLTDRDMNKEHEIDSAVGAFMFMRRSVLDKVGYFDEDYFLYAEDIDLCFRVKKAGFKVMYLPQVKIMHVKGASSGIKKHSQGESKASSSTKNLAANYFYKTMGIFYKKHYAKSYPFFFNWMVLSAIDVKRRIALRKKQV